MCIRDSDGNGHVGINTNSPATGTHTSYQNLVIGESTDATSGLSFKASTTGQSAIFFSDGASPFNRGQVLYNHNGDYLGFSAGGNQRIAVNTTAAVFGDTTTLADGMTGTPNDINQAEMGPGYLRLKRDDTATAKQLTFDKNGVVHSYLETSTSGLNIGGVNVGIGTTSPNAKLDVLDGAYGVTYPIIVNNPLAGFNGRGSGIQFNNGSTNQTAIFYYHYGTTASFFFDADLFRYRNLSSGATLFEMNDAGNASLTGALTQNTSDERLKDNITEIPNAIDKIKELKGVTFEWKGNGAKDFPYIDGTKDMGVIAQDVQKVLPEAVDPAPFDLEKEMEENSDGSFTEKLTSKSGEDYLTVHYEKLIPVLIQGMKEQQALIEALQTKVAALEGE